MNKIYLSDSGPKVSPAVYGFWRWEDTSATGVATMEKIVNFCLELASIHLTTQIYMAATSAKSYSVMY
ncbi:MAG: hypothetical protein WDO16_14430 [Bacteroidota bacterium]